MTPSTVPTFCTVCLAAMIAAGSSHWWSVNHFVASFDAGLVPSPKTNPTIPVKKEEPVAVATRAAPPVSPSIEQKNFYDALLKKINALENQNKELMGQMAETSNEVMTQGFQMNTFSNQYRPLVVGESQSENSLGDASVLPPVPRADPVFPLENE